MPRARGAARHEFLFAIAQRGGVEEGKRGEREVEGDLVGLVKSRLCVISDVYAIAARRCTIRKIAPVHRNCTLLVTLSARGRHADKRRACSARPYDFFEPRSQLVSSYCNCETHRVHVTKLRRAKNEIQTRKLSFFVVAR